MKRAAAYILAALLLVLVGCGGPTSENGGGEAAAVRTVTDSFGRQVEIPVEVRRVAALGSAARMLTYAGAADRIVGVSDLEKRADPEMPYTRVNREQFADCVSVASGGSGNAVYLEELATLAPDLIVLFDSDPALAETLQSQLNLPTVCIYADNFYDPGFCDTLRLLGEIMGTGAHVETVTDAVQGWVADLDSRTADIPEAEKPTVYAGAVSWSGAHGFAGTYAQYLTIGYKAALYAIRLLEMRFSEDEELVCIAENDACGVDAIQAILGCSVGKGNLLFHLTGKQAFSFYNRTTGRAVRLLLRPREPMDREASLAYLQAREPEELFDVGSPRIPLPEPARLFRSVRCAVCGEETAEHLCRLQNGAAVCLDCAVGYDRFRV